MDKPTPNPAAAAKVIDYADRFLAVLERIAVALEGKVIVKHAPVAPVSTPAAASPTSAPPSSPVAAQESISYDTVRKAVMAFQDAKGVHAASNVLKSFGAQYIMDLKAHPEKFADVLKALQ